MLESSGTIPVHYLSPWMESMLKIVWNDFSALFISMDGEYAENRLERFQRTINY